jgi:hypothetical protein
MRNQTTIRNKRKIQRHGGEQDVKKDCEEPADERRATTALSRLYKWRVMYEQVYGIVLCLILRMG